MESWTPLALATPTDSWRRCPSGLGISPGMARATPAAWECGSGASKACASTGPRSVLASATTWERTTPAPSAFQTP
eukprot:12651735-Prorocentrum_lima.AAC.1